MNKYGFFLFSLFFSFCIFSKKKIFFLKKYSQNHLLKSVRNAKLYLYSILASIMRLKKYFVSTKSFWSGGAI